MEAGQRPRLRPLIFLLAALALAGCSGTQWVSRFYVFRAEQTFAEAYALRTKDREAYRSERLRLYRTACDYFWKALQLDRNVFTLNRIESAADACLRIGDFERERVLREFEGEYTQTHPDEAEYGDSGAYMALEG